MQKETKKEALSSYLNVNKKPNSLPKGIGAECVTALSFLLTRGELCPC